MWSGLGFCRDEKLFHRGVIFNPEFDSFEIMSLGQLGGGRFFLKVKSGEIVVGIGVSGVDFDGTAEFLLGSINPTSAAYHHAKEIAGSGIVRVVESCLRKGGEGFWEAILVHINHPESEPSRGCFETLSNGLLEEIFRLRGIACVKFNHAEIHEAVLVLRIE
jgi:hypothetical protein